MIKYDLINLLFKKKKFNDRLVFCIIHTPRVAVSYSIFLFLYLYNLLKMLVPTGGTRGTPFSSTAQAKLQLSIPDVFRKTIFSELESKLTATPLEREKTGIYESESYSHLIGTLKFI